MPLNGSLRFLYEADTLFRHACTLQERGKFHQSLKEFRSSLGYYRRAKSLVSQIDTWLKLGDIFRQTEDFSSAKKAYRSAFALATKHLSKNLLPKRQDARLGEALCLRGEGNFLQALSALNDCLTGYRSHKDLEGEAYVLWAMGTTERFAGRFRDAQLHLQKSLALGRRLDDSSGTAYALCGLGGTLRMQGRPAQSFECYRAANAIFKKLEDLFGQAYSYCGQSNALRMQGKVAQALSYMQTAEKLYRSLKLKGPLAFVLWSQTQAFGALQQWDLAEKTLYESEQLFRSVKDKRGLLYVSLAKAEMKRLRNDSKYQSVFKFAAKTAKKLKLPFEQAHALRFSHPKQALQIYRRCGVKFAAPLFQILP